LLSACRECHRAARRTSAPWEIVLSVVFLNRGFSCFSKTVKHSFNKRGNRAFADSVVTNKAVESAVKLDAHIGERAEAFYVTFNNSQ
jgi:hypothetical protein